ncbi:MAG: hypothetical protein OEU09_21585 [Rhodospirillales bacterium]|nr:hypothetical protein [Rhodospirillales bacterium]
MIDTHTSAAGGPDEDGHDSPDTQADLAVLVDSIIETWRERQDHHRAEKSLTLQIKARCRRLCGGDKARANAIHDRLDKVEAEGEPEDLRVARDVNVHFLAARAEIAGHHAALRKHLERLAAQLPIAGFVDDVPGLAFLGLGAIVGEAGDLSNYANPAKLWKRFGLAVMPDGLRQRKVAGAAALEHGYAPARRSVVWTLGDSLIKKQGPYRELYLARKEVERAKAEAAGLEVRPQARIPAKNAAAFMSDGHVHNRAKRYMEKRLLRELWRAWRRAAIPPLDPIGEVPLAEEAAE